MFNRAENQHYIGDDPEEHYVGCISSSALRLLLLGVGSGWDAFEASEVKAARGIVLLMATAMSSNKWPSNLLAATQAGEKEANSMTKAALARCGLLWAASKAAIGLHM